MLEFRIGRGTEVRDESEAGQTGKVRRSRVPPVSAAVRELAGEGDEAEEGYTVGALPDARAMGLHS